MDQAEALRLRADTLTQVLVPALDAPMLSSDDEHHLVRVLRARDGERVCLIDGSGAWRLAEWRGQLVPISEIENDPAPSVEVAVAFPPLKGDRTELVVQKLTELGVDRIVLLSVDNAVVQWGSKRDKVMTRMERVVHEAAMQSRRTRLPTIDGLRSVADVVAEDFVLAQWGGEAVSSSNPRIAIGPEGGWSPAELAAAAATVTLGATILRAETAAIAAGVLLASSR